MPEDLRAGDALLDAWLGLTSTLWNTRLVASMTFNEAHILGILLHHRRDAVPQTATGLIARTHLLKSQMNKVLSTLEGKGFITRTRAQADRRMLYISLTDAGEAAYRQEHARIEAILRALIDRIGAERARAIAGDINEVTAALDDILPD